MIELYILFSPLKLISFLVFYFLCKLFETNMQKEYMHACIAVIYIILYVCIYVVHYICTLHKFPNHPSIQNINTGIAISCNYNVKLILNYLKDQENEAKSIFNLLSPRSRQSILNSFQFCVSSLAFQIHFISSSMSFRCNSICISLRLYFDFSFI